MMLVCSRWMMWTLAGALFLGCNEPTGALSLPAAVGRPAEASQGPRVGVIVALGGQATIVPSKGQAFPGRPEQQLLRDDKVVTAADSFVVVQLHNGHLVRLGASQSNVVEMLAPFHDPPAGDDVEARFVRLLTPAERDDPTLSGAITRVAGWNTRMSASENFAALPAAEGLGASAPAVAPAPEAQGDSPREERDDIEGVADADKKSRGRSEAKSSPAPAEIEEARKPADDKPTDKDADDSNAKSKGKSAKSEEESAPDGGGDIGGHPGAPAPAAAQLPGKLKFTPASGAATQTLELPTPLKGAQALANCAGIGAKITGSVKDHKLVALKVDGKIRCQELVGKPSTLDDGSFELTVTP